MAAISESMADLQKLFGNMRSNPFHTVLLLFALGAGVFVGSLLKTAGGKVGEITVDVLKSGFMARLAPSRITPLSYRVAVINQSKSITDYEVKKVVSALQKQVNNDFAPIWGVNAKLSFTAEGKKPDPQSWWLEIHDESDQSEMISYHSVTSEGLPLARISATEASKYGIGWTVAASHELLSMLVDPHANLSVLRESETRQGTLYMYEVAAPCQGPKYGYEIDGVRVSDFVTPAWFDASAQPGSHFDFGGHVASPFTILPGDTRECSTSPRVVAGGSRQNLKRHAICDISRALQFVG
jgi:hypothetical protein